MARKPRLEVEGGLYHVITRGVDRRDIFHSAEDHQKFLALLGVQKDKLPFYLYAYCLMTNHIHLLIERRTDDIGRIMHRVLTGYTQYYNRKYRRSGHVLQGRHKAILCQSDPYLAELVRYIHLNPIRAKMVERVEEYPYSSHRAYMGLESVGIVDVDPVLRRFGAKKAVARERFAKHVAAGMKLVHLDQLYETKGGVLGSEEFVDSMIHRMGEFDVRAASIRRNAAIKPELRAELLISIVENVCAVPRDLFCGPSKGARYVFAKEALILTGRDLGASVTALSHIAGLTAASVSRRHDIARRRMENDRTLKTSCDKIREQYERKSHRES
jgi:REP element-mobilizing transposase RayT